MRKSMCQCGGKGCAKCKKGMGGKPFPPKPMKPGKKPPKGY